MCSVNNFYESLQFWLHGVSKYSIKFTVHFHQFHYVSKESTLSLISHYFTLDWFFRISTYKPHTVETFHCSCIFPLLHTFFFSNLRPFFNISALFFIFERLFSILERIFFILELIFHIYLQIIFNIVMRSQPMYNFLWRHDLVHWFLTISRLIDFLEFQLTDIALLRLFNPRFVVFSLFCAPFLY